MIMGILSFIGGAISAIGSAIGLALSVIVAPKIFTISTILQAIAIALGLLKNEKPDDLGDRVLQAEEKGIKPENYKVHADYQKEIDNFKVDPKRSAEISQVDKLKKFIEYTGMGIADKYQIDPTQFVTSEILKNSSFYNKDRVSAYIQAFSDSRLELDNVTKYMEGKITSIDDIKNVREALLTAEKRIPGNESRSDNELLSLVNSVKRV
jgi:hypothetical protein